jgi:hypothetical protein
MQSDFSPRPLSHLPCLAFRFPHRSPATVVVLRSSCVIFLVLVTCVGPAATDVVPCLDVPRIVVLKRRFLFGFPSNSGDEPGIARIDDVFLRRAYRPER